MIGSPNADNFTIGPLVESLPSVSGLAGDDRFTVVQQPASRVTISGGTGADLLSVQGTNGNDRIHVIAGQIHQGSDTLSPEMVYAEVENLDLVMGLGDDVASIQMPATAQPALPNRIIVDGADGFDRLKITGTAGNDVIRVGATTVDDTAPIRLNRVEVLHAFGRAGNDYIQNETHRGIAATSLLDGGSGNDRLVGSTASDILFGGLGMDWLQGGAGHDLLYADHDYNNGSPVAGVGDFDKLDGGPGFDVLVALAIDLLVQETAGDTSRDYVVGNRSVLAFSPTFQANFVEPTNQNIAGALQFRLNLPAGHPF